MNMNKKWVLFFTSFLLIFSVFLSSNVLAQSSIFDLDDAGPTELDNNLTVIVCANSNESISGFNFWYNETGPLNATNDGIVKALFNNETEYDDTQFVGFTNSSGNPGDDQGCVEFILNYSANWTTDRVMVNVTIYNQTNYSSAGNKSMFTINYVIIQTKDAAGGNVVPNAVILTFNNETKSFICDGPAATATDGYLAEHCIGVVSGTDCIGESSGESNNTCKFHGISFSSEGEESLECQINKNTTIYALDFVSSNTSILNVTPGTLLIMNLSTPSTSTMVMAFNLTMDRPGELNTSTVSVYDGTNHIFYLLCGDSDGDGDVDGDGGGCPPAFLQPNKLYTLSVNITDSVYNYSFMSPSVGMTAAQIELSTTSSDYTTFVGKVVNESGDVMPGTVVYAQMFKGGSSFGISFINSSVTDESGLFSVRVPRTEWVSEEGDMRPFPAYQFYIVSNQTSSSVPIYFPTIDNNDNRGYFASEGTTILPPLVLKAGGQINVNVTLNNATFVESELSKFLSLGTGLIRDAVTGKMSMLSIFTDSSVSLPTNIIVSLLSPVNTTANTLAVNIFGKNVSMTEGGPPTGPTLGVCFNTSASITQGNIFSMLCNLIQPGFLNLTSTKYDDIFNYSAGNQTENLGNFGFWFETNGILRDNSTGNVIAYLNPEGMLLPGLLAFTESDTSNITIPLPPGNYTLELVPGFEHSNYLNVYNGTSFTITTGETENLNMIRGNAWQINPMFNPSLIYSESNSINVSVNGYSGTLNNNYVTLNGSKILFLNRSIVSSETILFGYDSEKNIFYNTTFKPSDFVSSPGKYMLLLNATNITGNDVFTTSLLMPINAYDFQIGLDLGGFTFGTGQNVSGRIFAFNSTGPIDSNTSAIIIEMFDASGNKLSTTASPSAISNGMGSINIIMPSSLGFYEITTTVNASNKYGVADNWIQVSNLNIKISTDRHNYRQSDNVVLTVEVSNATNGSAISGASVEVVVDNENTPTAESTDAEGKAKITLNPSLIRSSGSWSFGWHNLKIKISKKIGNEIIKLDTWYGFDVRGMDLFIRLDRPVYLPTENVTLDVFGAPGFTVSETITVDDTTITEDKTGNCVSGVRFCMNDVDNTYKQINLVNWTIGHHDVEITAYYGGGSQKFYTGFDVNDKKIIASTNKFSYDLNEWINLTVKVMALNGTALSGQNVVATLYKAQPPNDINVTQNTTITGPDGSNSTLLNASQPGFNYIKVNVSNQLQFIGVQVSSLKVTLLNAIGGSVVTGYTATPGDTLRIYVNATSGGSDVPDGSTVKAKLWAFGTPMELPSNETTDGNATISYQIPALAPAQVYGLEVVVKTPTGEMGFAPAKLTVTGGAALQLRASTDRPLYRPNDSDTFAPAIFTAILTYPNGTGVSRYNITFEVGSESGTSQIVDTAITNENGVAMVTGDSSKMPTMDGPYNLHAYLTEKPDVRVYLGFMVSSLDILVQPTKYLELHTRTYEPGENITLNVSIWESGSPGSPISATSGFITTFGKERGEIRQFFDPTGKDQPYQINITIPNESSSLGTWPIKVTMFVNQSQALAPVLVDVINSTESLNLTLPDTINASTPFLVNISASTGTTASLRIYSPGARELIYENTSVNITSENATVNVTIPNLGVYFINAFVNEIGGKTRVVSVLYTSGTIPEVWTGISTSSNTAIFTTSQPVYIKTNLANATATVLTVTTTNATKSIPIPLNRNETGTYYGVLDSSQTTSGNTYFVRLDTDKSSGVATTMFGVS